MRAERRARLAAAERAAQAAAAAAEAKKEAEERAVARRAAEDGDKPSAPAEERYNPYLAHLAPRKRGRGEEEEWEEEGW